MYKEWKIPAIRQVKGDQQTMKLMDDHGMTIPIKQNRQQFDNNSQGSIVDKRHPTVKEQDRQ